MQNKTMVNWEEKTLESMCNIEIGKTPSRSNAKFWDKNFSTNNTWLSIADLNNTIDKQVYKSKEHLSELGASEVKIVKKGTLLLSFKLTIGRVAIAGKDLRTNEAIAQLPIKNENILSKYFLYYYLQYFNYDSLLKGDIKVKGKTLNKEKLSVMPIVYPKDILEQERIVGILDKTFETIEKAKQNAEQNLKNAKELFENITEAIFADISGEKVKLSLLTSLITKGSSPKWQGFDYCTKTDDSILFITSENVGKDLLLLEKLKYLPIKFNDIQSRSILQKGDILTNIVGASIGRTAIFNLEETCNINQAVCLIRLKNPKYIPFIVKFLNTKMAISSMLGMVKDCARANISLTNISDLYVPLPELTKQQEIVNKLDKLQEQTKQLEKIYEQKIKDLDELKQSILQKAFRGEL